MAQLISAMGQGAGKLAWLKLTRGYQTGRRSERRHGYVSFRQPLNGPGRREHQHNEDYEQLASEDIQRPSSSSFFDSPSPLGQVSSGLLDEPLLENTGTGEPICQSVSSQTFEVNTSPFSLFSHDLEGNEFSGDFMNHYENSEDLVEHASGGHNDFNGQNGFAFVNTDSYEPYISDEEESDTQEELYVMTDEAAAFQETLSEMFSEVENGINYFSLLQSPLSTLSCSVSRECCEESVPMPLVRYFGIDPDSACLNNGMSNSSAGDQAIPKSNLSGANYETQQINTVDFGVGTPLAVANELNVNDYNTDEGNSPELVVRPKIRKQNTVNELEREKFLCNGDEKEGASWWRSGTAEVQQDCVEWIWRNSEGEMSSTMLFDSREYEGHQKSTEVDLREDVADEDDVLSDSTFWDKFEDCSRRLSLFHKDEHSSECSDGEWSTAMLACFTAMEKAQASSGESWETVPGGEEDEFQVQSISSDTEEQNANLCFQGGEHISLEEGEILPWLQYRQEVESSSEDDPVTDFVCPGYLLLDGNNNLEDDSSVSEDLDVEWSVLDEFDDGIGLSQAIPCVNPGFVTFLTLEGRLQQAVEEALAHLESLGFDEQAQPPADKETIDGLPQIVVTDDHDGQEQCCTICCSEYVKDEIITELPCHHLFHKPCVTLWLQNSGTCPVCRHVLTPVPPEAAAATVSVLSERGSITSVDTATETSN
ncbi:E3 ubiquitin-protein ligase Praja-2 isoform X1 [Phalacrocorax aristotelis]|uniref:E3 ubiquitin-protein ligase Praja-2 isoform X1 n=2 Tax=Phalacrocorax aristotelis TaxID=126867 RepID=UPI003F4B6A1C